MSTPISSATLAYGNAAKLISEGANPLGTTSGAGQGPDFARLLGESLSSVVQTGRATDARMMEMVNGKADVVDVVTAVAQSELAIETMVTVRDRVISAYEEIMRMPI